MSMESINRRMRFVFDNTPLLKILLHGAKFSTSSINGLLIGRSNKDGVRVVDAIPLFHTILTLSPHLEIALALVSLSCISVWVSRSLKVDQRLKGTDDGIVGLYVADAHMSRDDFDAASKTIANKLATLTTTQSTLALIVYHTASYRSHRDVTVCLQMENSGLREMMQLDNVLPFKVSICPIGRYVIIDSDV